MVRGCYLAVLVLGLMAEFGHFSVLDSNIETLPGLCDEALVEVVTNTTDMKI